MSVIIPKAEMTFMGEDMDIATGLNKLTYTENVYGCAVYKIDATVLKNFSIWDRVVQDMGENPAKLRLGFQVDDQSPEWGPWKDILLTNSSFRYTYPIMQVKASGTCAGLKMTEKYNEKTYKDKRISEIVEDIAKRNGLDADVEGTKGKYWIHQCTLPDGHFIKQVLLPLAVSNSNRADYYFWIQDGKKLVFKPPKLTGASRTFAASARGITGEYPILGLTVHYRRIMMGDEESLKTTGRGYDVFKKEFITWDADDNSVKYDHLAPKAPKPPKEASKVILMNRPISRENRKDEVKEATQAAWGKHIHGLFRLSLKTVPIPDLQPAEVVQVSIKDQNDQDHFMSGNYFLYSSTQRLSGGVLVTILNLERRTYR